MGEDIELRGIFEETGICRVVTQKGRTILKVIRIQDKSSLIHIPEILFFKVYFMV